MYYSLISIRNLYRKYLVGPDNIPIGPRSSRAQAFDYGWSCPDDSACENPRNPCYPAEDTTPAGEPPWWWARLRKWIANYKRVRPVYDAGLTIGLAPTLCWPVSG